MTDIPSDYSRAEGRERAAQPGLDELEQRADALRERLISDVTELTERTRRARNLIRTLAHRVKAYKKPLFIAGFGVVALSVGIVLTQRARRERQERHRRALGQLATSLTDALDVLGRAATVRDE